MIKLWFSQRRKTKFNYLKDRLFLLAVFVYLLNRWIVKPLTIGKISFFSSYLNDIICFPFLLPIVLFLTRVVRLRKHNGPPDIYEMGFYFLLWSYVFEFIGPMYGSRFNNPVSDPWDVVCYALGGLVAGIYWNFRIFARK
jgi:hypothetical protein